VEVGEQMRLRTRFGGIDAKALALPECQLAFMIERDPPSGKIDVGA